MFPHEGLDREGKSGGVEQDLTAAIDHINKFSEQISGVFLLPINTNALLTLVASGR